MVASADTPAFFTDWSSLCQEDYLRVTYDFVSTIEPRQAIAGLCAEQSTAMWRRVGVQEDLRGAYGAKCVALEQINLDPRVTPEDDHRTLYRAVIAHPHRNFGPRIPNLLVALAGEGVFHVPGMATVQLVDITFPDAYLQAFSGPQFGLTGVREQWQIYDRPIFFGVVKPNLGLSPNDFAQLAHEAWCGGLDIAKDDEMLADTQWSPTATRVAAVTQARLQAEAETGVSKGFIANVTDHPEEMMALARKVIGLGATTIMINPMWTGLGALTALRSKSPVPIMSHFAGAAVVSRTPNFGIAAPLWVKLQRLAGADMIGIPGFGGRMHSPEGEVHASIAACLEPLGVIATALPIPGGSDSAKTFPDVCTKVGHRDFGFIAGRGIFGHPEGPRAGAASIVEAWQKWCHCEADCAEAIQKKTGLPRRPLGSSQ